jgi:peptide/nickel transport system substrate-binding protein/microcin C transport system substrate-binding protein
MRENDIKQIDQKRLAQSASRLFIIQSNEPRTLWYVGFNLTRPVFQSKKLRKAFMLLFNRQEIINKIRGGRETVASGPFDPSSPYVSKIKPLPFDPEQAKKLLAEDGWIDTDKDGILDKVLQGVKTKLDFSIYYSKKSDEPWISYFAEDLRKAGIKLNLNLVDGAQYFKKLDNLEQDLFAAGWSEDVPMGDPRIPYHSEGAVSGGENLTRYINKEVDKLFDEARLLTDEKKRIKIYQKIHDLIADDLPMLFAFYNKDRYYYRSNRMGVPADTLNYRTGMETWWIKDLKK